ncbi:hypothetical protein KFK09_007536 [Dendrobium nobile]|uniref:RING-type domain-containing protein n=1 Tax=Dendrobium nobile TaxID=94219 RepID=A0A8T3BWT3_DENNO|nr:hypothetical protein KFK09_007536 [Dendrobium nobile]
MTMRKLLPSSFMSMLFLPCLSTLLLLLKPLLRILHLQSTTPTHAQSMNPNSLETYLAVCNRATSISDTNIAIFQYKQVVGEQLLCIFCLSEVGEGESVRQLSCSHLFHSSCFDKWIEHRRTNCPLCRCSLILLETKAEQLDHEIEDEEVEDSATPLLAFVQREWWGVVHPCG